MKGYTLARMGRRSEAEQVLHTLLETGRARFVPPYNVALIFAGLEDAGPMYEWLGKAHDVRDAHIVFLPVEPKWDPWRGDAPFAGLLERCGIGPRLMRAAEAVQS